MRKAYIGLLLILISELVSAQYAGIYPLSLLRIKDNYSFENPASAILSESSHLGLIANYFTGLSGKVGVNYINAVLNIKSASKGQFHKPGIVVHSEFETEILKRTRAYFRYSYSLPVNSNTNLSAGLMLGIFNYFIKSSNSSAGFSSIVPDATAGLWINNKKYNVGLSSSQLFNAIIKPINTSYYLNRYFNFHADLNLLSIQNVNLQGLLRLNYNRHNLSIINPGLSLTLFNNFSTEFNYVLKRGFALTGGIVRFSFLTINGDLYLTYFNTIGENNLLNINRLEISTKIYRFGN